MRRLTREQVNQFLKTGHYIMPGKSSNKRSQTQRDWHRRQVEKVMMPETSPQQPTEEAYSPPERKPAL